MSNIKFSPSTQRLIAVAAEAYQAQFDAWNDAEFAKRQAVHAKARTAAAEAMTYEMMAPIEVAA